MQHFLIFCFVGWIAYHKQSNIIFSNKSLRQESHPTLKIDSIDDLLTSKKSKKIGDQVKILLKNAAKRPFIEAQKKIVNIFQMLRKGAEALEDGTGSGAPETKKQNCIKYQDGRPGVTGTSMRYLGYIYKEEMKKTNDPSKRKNWKIKSSPATKNLLKWEII